MSAGAREKKTVSSSPPERREATAPPFRLLADAVVLSVSEAVYPLDAVYGAAYLFVDRCWVFLDRARTGEVRVRLTPRAAADPAARKALAGEFANELLNQALRLRLAESTARIREYYTAAALRASSAGPSIDDILAQLESEELEEDPLQILVPWEEKYGKTTDPDGTSGGPADPAREGAAGRADGPEGEVQGG